MRKFAARSRCASDSVHRPEDFADDPGGVRAVGLAHLPLTVFVNRFSPWKMPVSSAKKQKMRRAKKVIKLLALGVGVPAGVVADEFDVEPVEPPRRLDVEGVLADRLDRANAGQAQKIAEMVAEFGEVADQRRFGLVGEVLGLDRRAVGGESELRLVLDRRGAGDHLLQGGRRLAGRTGREVDVVAMAGQKRARHVALVVPLAAGSELLDGGGVEVERLKKLERELGGDERAFGELAHRFFDFDSVHRDGIPRT